MEFGALHGAECGGVLIMSPVPIWPHENDLVAKQTALTEILLPIIRHENLERWNYRECFRWSTETEQMKCERIWWKTCPKKCPSARGERQRSFGFDVLRRHASLQLVEGS